VQQAAYETLLRSRRQDLHARVAKAIMERLPDEAEHRSHLLLHHATLAGNHELAALACVNARFQVMERISLHCRSRSAIVVRSASDGGCSKERSTMIRPMDFSSGYEFSAT
jgi:hypothetical protein